MRQGFFAVALLLAPWVAAAQQKSPEMVLIPLPVAEAVANWIVAPDATNAVRLFSALQACIKNNPIGGVTTRIGPDQCPEVTEAIAARGKQIADLQKQLTDAKGRPPEK